MALGRDVKWHVGPETRPLDFERRLAERGFTSWAARAMGVATERDLPRAGRVRVIPVATDADVDTSVTVSPLGWAALADQHALERAAIHRGTCRRV